MVLLAMAMLLLRASETWERDTGRIQCFRVFEKEVAAIGSRVSSSPATTRYCADIPHRAPPVANHHFRFAACARSKRSRRQLGKRRKIDVELI